MSTFIADGNGLVSYIQTFTGSKDTQEIQNCVFLTEMMLRNIELPALRSDPSTTIGTADVNGNVPVPPDMHHPILFYNQGNNPSSNSGPWMVYDRIGDRDMITQQLVQNLYLYPFNIPEVFHGQFSEVSQSYQFLPKLAAGSTINMYYFKTWPLLFTYETDGVTETLSNVVLQSFPEGYVYGTLHNYYLKRKMPDDAALWLAKFNDACNTIADQNAKGKWSGGHNKITSIYQPRRLGRYTTK